MYEWSAKHACRNARDEQSELSVGIVVCVLLSSMRKMSHHLPCKDTNSWQLNVFCESPCKFYSECSWFRSSGDSLLFQYKQNRAACVFACVCVCVCVCTTKLAGFQTISMPKSQEWVLSVHLLRTSFKSL